MQLDGVVPTAVEALDRKRGVRRVLRDIDALLQDDNDGNRTRLHKAPMPAAKATMRGQRCSSSTDDGAAESSAVFGTPGPGAYSPETRVVDKKTHFMAKFDAYSGRTLRVLPWKLGKRNLRTPGTNCFLN